MCRSRRKATAPHKNFLFEAVSRKKVRKHVVLPQPRGSESIASNRKLPVGPEPEVHVSVQMTA